MATKNCLLLVSAVWSMVSFVHGFLDIDELQSVHYGIDILREPVVFGKDEPPGAVYLQSKFGQQYQCSFPDHSQQERQKEAEEKLAIEIGIPELLRPLEAGPCLTKTKDWWTYEFCYGKHIRQFHQEEGKISGEILYLGLFESEFDWDKEDISAKQKNYLNRYHSQQYVNGTMCELIQEPRKTEVRFVCEEGSGDYISRIDEPETCVYILTVHTTKICHHPNLKPRAHSHNVPILCNPVISDTQYQKYLIDLEEERLIMKKETETALEDNSDTENPDLGERSRRKLFADPDEPKNPRAELNELLTKVLTKKEVEVPDESEFNVDNDDLLTDNTHDQSETTSGEDLAEDLPSVDQATHIADTNTAAGPDNGEQGDNIEGTDHPVGPGTTEQQAEDGFGLDDDQLNVDTKEMMKRLKTVLQTQLDKVFKETEDYVDRLDEDNDIEDGEGEGEMDSDQNVQQGEAASDGNSQLNRKQNPVLTKLMEKISNRKKEKAKETSELDRVEDSDRVKMRVTRIKSRDLADDDPNNPSPQKHVVETTIQDELQKAGLDTDGGKIRVKIITAGYYDSDESTIHVLSEEDSAAFNKMIVAILGGNQEAAKEAARHKELEDNYSLVWDKRTKKTKGA